MATVEAEEVEVEEPVRLSVASAWLDSHPTTQTLRRWIVEGISGKKLPAVRIGKRFFVRLSELAGFVAELNRERSAPREVATP